MAAISVTPPKLGLFAPKCKDCYFESSLSGYEIDSVFSAFKQPQNLRTDGCCGLIAGYVGYSRGGGKFVIKVGNRFNVFTESTLEEWLHFKRKGLSCRDLIGRSIVNPGNEFMKLPNGSMYRMGFHVELR